MAYEPQTITLEVVISTEWEKVALLDDLNQQRYVLSVKEV